MGSEDVRSTEVEVTRKMKVGCGFDAGNADWV